MDLLFHPSGLLVVVTYNMSKMRLWDVAAQQEASPAMQGVRSAGGFPLLWSPGWFDNAILWDHSFDLPTEDRPAGDLVKLGQLYSGLRQVATGGTAPLRREERQALWRELRDRYPEEFAVSDAAVIAWRIDYLAAWLAFGRQWLAAELAECGWQPGEQGNEKLEVWDYLQRLQALALHGSHNEAVAAADALAARWNKDADTLYDCARVPALAATAVNGDAALSERYAARAVALLRQAVDAGYANAGHMRKDSDLDSLRRREDFRELLKKLDAKKP
jgi:hypothetical protein